MPTSDRNDAFTSAPIAKRHEPLTLQDEDGVVVLLCGSMIWSRMRENGFSMQVCTFSIVFLLLCFLFINPTVSVLIHVQKDHLVMLLIYYSDK